MQPTYQADNEEMGLTAAAKAEDELHRQERYSDTYHRRGSVESQDFWEEARRLGRRAFMRKIAVNATLIGLWYVFYATSVQYACSLCF